MNADEPQREYRIARVLEARREFSAAAKHYESAIRYPETRERAEGRLLSIFRIGAIDGGLRAEMAARLAASGDCSLALAEFAWSQDIDRISPHAERGSQTAAGDARPTEASLYAEAQVAWKTGERARAGTLYGSSQSRV